MLHSPLRSIPYVLVIFVLSAFTGCKKAKSSSETGPSEFGLDERPSNPSCVAPARPRSTTGVSIDPAFPSLTFSRPVFMLQAPKADHTLDDSQWFVVEQGGVIRKFSNTSGVTSSSTFVDLTDRVQCCGEQGLLGFAFHPNWATNRTAYVSYTVAGGDSRIAKLTSSNGGITLDRTTSQTILDVAQPYSNHNGGWIGFGPDGYLYLAFGDGGSGGDPDENGQNMNALLGKILRLDVDGGTPYAIPSDNPFADGSAGRAEIYASGLRNPWRGSFDPETGELWFGDVGQNAWEEVDQIVRGGNYGWNTREGAHCFDPPSGCETAGLIDPVVEYPQTGSTSVTGANVYRGSSIPSLVGSVVFADYISGVVSRIAYDSDGVASIEELASTGFNISSFGQGRDGELYVLNYGTAGSIYRLNATASDTVDSFPNTLTATGCADDLNPTEPASGLIPYDINVPFWSDGAFKQRWMGVPDGSYITIAADGDWEFPIGTVLVKQFVDGGVPFETRLLMRHDDGDWAGYTYQWNDEATEATLLPASRTITRATGDEWTFPSRPQCMQCHTRVANRTLGPDTAQMNRNVTYANGREAGQLKTLDHIGMFTTPLAEDPATMPALVATDALAYLHSNCAQCHQPGGPGGGTIDFRYGEDPEMATYCNVDPDRGDLGISGAKLLVPGDPSRSLLLQRMQTRGANQMPPIGSHQVDSSGAELLTSWITSLSACP